MNKARLSQKSEAGPEGSGPQRLDLTLLVPIIELIWMQQCLDAQGLHWEPQKPHSDHHYLSMMADDVVHTSNND